MPPAVKAQSASTKDLFASTLYFAAASTGKKSHRSGDLLLCVFEWRGTVANLGGSPRDELGDVDLFCVPAKSNAHFAGAEHFIHHLALHGMVCIVIANGSMSSIQSGENS